MVRWLTYGVRGAGSKAAVAVALWLAAAGAAAADRTHILALGDSLTQGFGLIEQEGFVPQLRAWLEARGHDVRIVNAGVSGDTTAGGLARVDWSLTPEIEAMIVALGGNDLLRGIDPAVARENLEGILQIAAEKDLEVLLIGMTAPGNYGAEYKRSFDAIYPDLAARYDTLHVDNFLGALLAEDGGPRDPGSSMQSDGIHPSAEGVRQIVEEIGPAVERLIARVEADGQG